MMEKKYLKILLPVVLLGGGVLLILLGIGGGAAQSIWEKASTICLECIGIG